DNTGDILQAYLTVPVSGNYKFNVTGDDETIFFISSNDDPANKQAHQCFVSGWTNMTQHDKYIWQSTGDIFLQAGQYYYIEINNKQGGGGKHFSAFWQTPFSEANVWKRIPDMYVYDYDCEISCIPAGETCDDGDPFTNNDMYDGNCNCIGTPCSGPDCDSPLANYVPYDKCSVTDQVDNSQNGWLSCQPQDNPNPSRPRSHWIQYDLGIKHEIYDSHIWNYNKSGATQNGFESVAVDYSLDGTQWSSIGTYNWPLATGDDNYSGFVGPNFMGVEARYVLFTSLDDTTTCRGVHKIAFTAVRCPEMGNSCDDGDPNTTNDVYDENCECKGENFLENDCVDMNLTLGDSTLYTKKYSAIEYVNSVSEIDSTSKVSFVGGNSVVLDVGFETKPNAIFIAAIDTCDAANGQENGSLLSRSAQINQRLQQIEKDKQKGLQVITNETGTGHTIKFYLPEPAHVQISIISPLDGSSNVLINHDYVNQGLYTKRIRHDKFTSGVYEVVLTTDYGMEKEKMMID
ncbi:MAG: discoidin domain-containing protein, partial [Gammaproteobacteria bacterium]|nr:discoidin domain-containing protein [Gammaproteobacteria bacterium]